MAEEWLIDGYNLLHASASARTSKPKRDLGPWLAELAGYASLTKCTMLVVLDGAGDSGELEIHRTKFFSVVYSKKSSADAFIERRLFEHRSRTTFVVVTDDRAVTNIARGAGASVLGTRTFLEMMKETRKESSDALHKDKIRSHGFHRPFEDKLKD